MGYLSSTIHYGRVNMMHQDTEKSKIIVPEFAYVVSSLERYAGPKIHDIPGKVTALGGFIDALRRGLYPALTPDSTFGDFEAATAGDTEAAQRLRIAYGRIMRTYESAQELLTLRRQSALRARGSSFGLSTIGMNDF